MPFRSNRTKYARSLYAIPECAQLYCSGLQQRHRIAEKFSRPVICFIGSSGAYCGVDAEQRGQGEAIAENLMEMMALKTPIISVVIGEGGSGGALALSVADKIIIGHCGKHMDNYSTRKARK